ncbi:glycine oxidase ThiO [Aquipseudomonas alcaligenes]|uniref:Glycine oxidase n=1 Tax=Aquipseudomonas alcaligenes TaxID=43263 RepID=A0A1N6TWH8_AQUAC|nr:glycine oxidase ThiO [Pseudomonas alcaligenes]SIQ57436.1 glycine oxidase [Pseudomonas alcaligenes]
MQTDRKLDVAIIGGGVMGLLSALQLSRAGAVVKLYERLVIGHEASWAGGGIVSPLYPWRYDEAVGALATWSQDFYPEFAQALRVETGIDPEVRTTGLYWFDLEDEGSALAWGACKGRKLLSPPMDLVRGRLPQLGVGLSSALWMPEVANVRNPRLLEALKRALVRSAGVEVIEGADVQVLPVPGSGAFRVLADDREWRAQQVVVTTGAWSGGLLKQLGLKLPVEPVKGQMILYKCEPGFLPAIVLAKGRYAIPRKDGHILVGSTLEHVGFDKTPTEEALASLKASAEELLPALADAELVGHWAGLRPGSPDGIPFIGEVPQFPGLWLNCGHYRNGLVLAPASCELLKNLMLGETPIVDPAPYAPARRLGLV